MISPCPLISAAKPPPGTPLDIIGRLRPGAAHLLLVLVMLAVAGCTEATASRLGDRTFRIDGPGLPTESTAPNRRVAERLCPNGYRVLDRVVRRNTPDGIRDESGMFINWTIRCI